MTDTFAALNLPEPLLIALERQELTTPTPVQVETIPLMLAGRDVIAAAPTGTGKTAAFLLPALTQLLDPNAANNSKGIGPRILILTPTRELAQQISRVAIALAKEVKRCKVVCITGGESYFQQNRLLTAPFEILVATPGRLMDQMQQGRVDFRRLSMLVLDEADRMLDMGFAEDVLAIAQKLPSERQTVCFTATLSRSVKDLSSQLQHDPQIVDLTELSVRREAIDQQVIYIDDLDHKRRLIRHLLTQDTMTQGIVFTATKRAADELADELDADGLACEALHGDLNQRQRTRTLDKMRRGNCQILVATDVAARGIDVAAISHVFNFDLPRVAEDYVHRIGRTGRAGAKGMAVSFVGRQDIAIFRRIEQFIGGKLSVMEIEGLAARFNPETARPSGPRRSGGGGGGGRSYGRGAGGGDGYRGGESRGYGGFRSGESRGPRSEGHGPSGNFESRGPRHEGDRPNNRPRREFQSRRPSHSDAE